MSPCKRQRRTISRGLNTERMRESEGITTTSSRKDGCRGSSGHPRPSRRPAIVMMQAAEHWDRGDVASTRPRNATCGDRDPLTDPLMRPGDVEVAESVLLQHAQQVALAQDDHVVDALAP